MFRRLPLPLLLLLTLLAGVVSAQGTAATGEIKGVVRDGRNFPIPNAVVRVTFAPTLRSSDREARTDRDGRYSLADLDFGTYGLAMFKPGWLAQQKNNVVAAAKAVTVNWTTQWADSSRGSAEIYVRDSGGRVLPDATVDLLSAGTLQSRLPTDAGGAAIFPGLTPGTFAVVVRRPGYFDLIGPPFQVRAGGPSVFTATLRRDANQSGNLRGTVRGQNGGLISNALVRIIGGITGGQARTNGGGEYEFSGLVPSPSYALQITATGFAAQAVGGIPVQAVQTTVRDILLVPNAPTRGSLSGIVRDASGSPVSFASVTLVVAPGQAQGRQAVSGPDGRYVFQDLPPFDAYALVVESPGYAPEGRSAINVTAGRTTVVDVTLRFEQTPPGSVAGLVRETGSGAALAGVTVQVLQGPSAGLATLTDGSGSYSFARVVPAEGYTLRFSKDGYVPTSATLVRVRSALETSVNAELAVRVLQSGALSGTVRRLTGEPISGARVNLFTGPSAPLKTTTDTGGRYAFANVRSGTGHGLRVTKDGFITAERRQIQVTNGQTVMVDFQLSRGAATGGIRGRVLDLIQQPIAGATIRIAEGPFTPAPVQANAAGEFLLEGLPQGTYVVEASANGFRTGRQPNVSVTPQRITDVSIQLLR